MKIFLAVVLLVAIACNIQAQKGDCGPRICINDNSKCYEFGNGNVQWNWYEADQQCRRKGMHLANIETKTELDVINNYFKKCIKGTRNYWIGAQDTAKEGTFKWDFSGKPLTVTEWVPGEPNNANGNENCVQVYSVVRYSTGGSAYGLLLDKNCQTTKISYICEADRNCAASHFSDLVNG